VRLLDPDERPDPRAISLSSNSPNQNHLILVHFLQFHFRPASGDAAIYDDSESIIYIEREREREREKEERGRK